ncbi:hypothetical protein B0H19DRAFT_1071348 [Mycena capillaripes]|nr:hypothetical protein B0H19DRAFT_1071348 [Mycena capillaripes]
MTLSSSNSPVTGHSPGELNEMLQYTETSTGINISNYPQPQRITRAEAALRTPADIFSARPVCGGGLDAPDEEGGAPDAECAGLEIAGAPDVPDTPDTPPDGAGGAAGVVGVATSDGVGAGMEESPTEPFESTPVLSAETVTLSTAKPPALQPAVNSVCTMRRTVQLLLSLVLGYGSHFDLAAIASSQAVDDRASADGGKVAGKKLWGDSDRTHTYGVGEGSFETREPIDVPICAATERIEMNTRMHSIMNEGFLKRKTAKESERAKNENSNAQNSCKGQFILSTRT